MKSLMERVQSICIILLLQLAVYKHAREVDLYQVDMLAVNEEGRKNEVGTAQDKQQIVRVAVESASLMQTVINKPQEVICLKEIPEAGTKGLMRKGAYIAYKDMLVLWSDVYKREDGVYQLTGQTLNDLTKIEEEIEYYMQCENLILFIVDWKEPMLLVYDMDTGTTCRYAWGEGRKLDIMNWKLYQGEFYYVEEIENGHGGWTQDMAIRKMNPRTGESVEIYRCEKPALDNFWFFIRDDGTIFFEWVEWAERYADRWEYWKIQPNDDGSWEETRLYESDRWKFRESGIYKAYGFFVIGQYFEPTLITNEAGESYTTLFEDIVIKDNGEIETPVWVEGGLRLFCDHGYLLENEEDSHDGTQETGSVTYYDYHGNKINTYHLIDEEYLEEGYELVNLLYYDGTITGFYQQKDTKKLYVVQVDAELK